MHAVDTSQDALVLLRTIGNQKLKSVVFRDQRPHMMAEDINFELTDEQVSQWSLDARIGSVFMVDFYFGR